MDTARRFLELLSDDDTMQHQLYVSSPNTIEDLIGFAAGKGFLFTEAELRAALDDFPADAAVDTIRRKIIGVR